MTRRFVGSERSSLSPVAHREGGNAERQFGDDEPVDDPRGHDRCLSADDSA